RTRAGTGACTPRLGLLLVVSRGNIRCLRRAAASLFLRAAPGLGLGLQARFFLGLAARGFLTLAFAAFFFLGAALGIFLSTLPVLDLAGLGAFERPAAGFHLAARQFVQHHAGA
ncbi:hypothetical protein, partial [Mesorhizobium sp. M8A.F.Ca.ET.213.01.1.1]|uniref:hypothetical protein n=1 Tax=Mesorhizobium sp. M8A.F.Ca.ET.213.01.1.1 TaxID=2563970 RepID=UPI001AED5A98